MALSTPATAVCSSSAARVSFAPLLRSLEGVRPGVVVPYSATVEISVEAPAVGRLMLPVSHRGELPIPAAPEVSLRELRWGKVSLSEATAMLRVEVGNTNAFPFDLRRLGCSLSLAGERVAEEERARLLVRERVARAEAVGARRLEFLAEASRLLAASLDYRSNFQNVARLAVPYLADWCIFYMTEETGDGKDGVGRPAGETGNDALATAKVCRLADACSDAARMNAAADVKIDGHGIESAFAADVGCDCVRL